MNFQAKDTSIEQLKADCLVVAASEGDQQNAAFTSVDKLLKGQLSELIRAGDIKTGLGATTLLPGLALGSVKRLLVVGLGKTSPLSRDQFQKVARNIAGKLYSKSIKTAAIALDTIAVKGADDSWQASQVAREITLSSYQYDTTKSEKRKPVALKAVNYVVADKKLLAAAKKGLSHGAAVGEGMNLTRELGNLPGNYCTPAYLASQARSLARNQPKLSVKILKEKEMRELGMGSLLSVAAGSDQEAHLIVMEYKGAAKTVKPHALVGKGITFDSGGISLKPGLGMDEMKFDMCGAASVFGAMKTLLTLAPAINVVAVVAAAENMPNGKATKPGDVITSMSGKTIEVLNTDAEGRLILCDALTYVERFKPQSIIDIATLTGACIVALGKHMSGLYSNDDAMAGELAQLSQAVCDKAWHMPMGDEYQKQLDSNFADIANIGGPHGGSITAACFLSRFTEGFTWAHLDIAGVAWHSGNLKGATGRPVPLLVEYMLSKVGKK
ncbi:leucyl aminopeptidase [Halioxenophilus sp. WMMB6]|uniref:leucyl aminopeptidase n=1 Tax=Halioxenophilus sp. WMMB6 TaxID=3073815 RepID=UPI00295EE4D0|nr:leucyl aminopeptidase [Halioxenophilus sp. WMMB6]